MKLLTRRRNPTADESPTPVADEATKTVQEIDSTNPASTSPLALEWTGPAAWITRTLSWVLVASLAAGPLALALGAWMLLTSPSASTTPTPNATDADAADDRAAVESFAGNFLLTWLTTTTGQEARLNPFLSDLSAVTVPDAPAAVSAVSATGIKTTGNDTWSVTVAATVAGPTTNDPATAPAVSAVSAVSADTDGNSSERRYFQVSVLLTDAGALLALALPSPVAGPPMAASPKLGYRYRASTSDPIALAAGEFLTALLSGAGDVTRLTTPGSPIRSLTPAPYAAVNVDDVQVDQDPAAIDEDNLDDGRTIRVLVTATGAPAAAEGSDPAATAQGQGLSVQYALTLTARAGRWEVTAIDPSPLTTPTDSTPTDSTVPEPPAQGTSQSPAGSSTAPTDPSSTN